MAIQLSTAARSALIDGTGLNGYIGNGAKIRLYTASRPANPATAITSQTLLAELTCGTPFGTNSNGVLTAGSITSDSSADATGTAAWFRMFKSDGTTVVMDGDCGTSGSDLNLSTTSIVATGTVSISSFVLTAPNA